MSMPGVSLRGRPPCHVRRGVEKLSLWTVISMAIGDQDHGGIAVAIAVRFGTSEPGRHRSCNTDAYRYSQVAMRSALNGGRRKGRELIYAGKCDNGVTPQSEKEFRPRLKPLSRSTQP